MKKKMAIWGASYWGYTFKKILEEEGEEVVAIIDSDKSKWNEEVIGFEVFCNRYNIDDITILLSLRRWENVLAVEQRIREKSNNCEILYHYHLCKNYGNLHIRTLGYDVPFENQFKIWIDNIDSEISYWKNQVVSESGANHSHYLELIKRDKEFNFYFENYSNKIKQGDIILDIGCGVYSQYGNIINGSETVNLIGIDPLASIYNHMNAEYAKKQGLDKIDKIKFGMFEFLSYNLGSDYADAICIDNALDHCIDPFSAVIQAIDVVKPGKSIWIRCYFNEGFRERYGGLHRWNVSIDMNNDYIVWNRDNYINISKRIKDFADIQVYDISPDECKDSCGYAACLITKRASVPSYLLENSRSFAGLVMEIMMERIESNLQNC